MENEILDRIMNDSWPNIRMPENLELLNELADENFSTQTFSGMLSSMLMYHQIIEAICLHLLENCHFQIQLSVYPAKIMFSISENKMLGYYINELESSISFHKKEDFLTQVKSFNNTRNEIVHKMKKNNLDKISKKLINVKKSFDKILELYDEIQDDFRVIFHYFKKDVFMDEWDTAQ